MGSGWSALAFESDIPEFVLVLVHPNFSVEKTACFHTVISCEAEAHTRCMNSWHPLTGDIPSQRDSQCEFSFGNDVLTLLGSGPVNLSQLGL